MLAIPVNSPWPKKIVLKVLAAVWVLPNVILGFVVTLGVVLLNGFNVKFYVQRGGIDVACYGFLAKKLAASKWGAFTLGITMLHWLDPNEKDPNWTIEAILKRFEDLENPYWNELKIHERWHIHHQLMMGIFWIFVYLFMYGMLVAVAKGDTLKCYRWNPLEKYPRNRTYVPLDLKYIQTMNGEHRVSINEKECWLPLKHVLELPPEGTVGRAVITEWIFEEIMFQGYV